MQGGSPLGDGDAVLTAADAATNAGTIILESLDGVHHGYFRVPAGTFTNKASGVIQVNLPPGDAGPGSIIAGWLDLGDAGRLSSANFPVLPAFTSLLAQLQYYIALGIPVDPQLLQQALLMTQTPGVNSGVIGVGGVGSNGAPSSDGLVGYLTNQGGILIQSLTAPYQTANNILNDATGGAWSQSITPAVASAWQDGTAGALNGPFNNALGFEIPQVASWFEQQVAAPFVLAAVNRVASIPQGVLEVGYLIHDASLATAAAVVNAAGPGTAAWQPEMWSAYAAGLAQARANGHGQAYAINAVLNAGTFGLYGDVQSFGPALQQSLATGDWTALSSWAGGTLIDVASNPLAEGVLGELQATAAEVGESGALSRFLSDESGTADLEELGLVPAGGGPPVVETLAADGAPVVGDGVPAGSTPEARQATVTESWSEEATAEAQLGQADVGTRAAADANAEAGLTEAVNSAEATAEQVAKRGDAGDAASLLEGMNATETEQAAAVEAGGAAAQAEATAIQRLEEQTAALNQVDSPGGNAGLTNPSDQATALELLGNGEITILEATEQETINFSDLNWRDTKFASGNDSLVYVLRDVDTGELLKVGTSKVSTFLGRFGPYENAQAFTGRNLAADIFAFDGTEIGATAVESQVRNTLISQGQSLPWDNTRLPGAGGVPRLGRPGPGVPGTTPSRTLRNQGWHWEGENFLQMPE